jgi:S1-C subfamily serine protease
VNRAVLIFVFGISGTTSCVKALRHLSVPLLVAAAALAAGTGTAATGSATAGVVVVETKLGYQGGAAAGTGIVLTSSGEVLTNNHVIEGATSVRVVVPQTGRSYRARVVGYDVAADTAVL